MQHVLLPEEPRSDPHWVNPEKVVAQSCHRPSCRYRDASSSTGRSLTLHLLVAAAAIRAAVPITARRNPPLCRTEGAIDASLLGDAGLMRSHPCEHGGGNETPT